jgi:hypothetical protein
MRITAVCPLCQARIPRQLAWNKQQRDVRKCPACNTLLRRFDTDRQPLTTIIVLLIFAPLLPALFVAVLFYSHIGVIAWAIPLAATPVCYAINQWQFPYTNGFEVWRPRCASCGRDIPDGSQMCPKCGGKPEVPD